MRILVINIDKNIFKPNSASLARLRQYAGLCEKMKVVVLTRRKFAPIKEGNLEVYATGSINRLRYFTDAKKIIRRIMKDEKMDLVMTQDPFETGLLGWMVKRKYKLSWQCQIHGDILSPYYRKESIINKIRVRLAKFLLPRADGIRVVSERIKKSLLENLKLKAEPVVLPIFVDTGKLKLAEIKNNLKEKYPQFDFIALMASRISKEKNISLALEAFAEIVKKNAKAGLVIAGEGKEKDKLKLLVTSYKLSESVIFEPWSHDLASYYKTADAFLLTSNYEGWGMTAVEAAACGCPIVMTDVGCAGELIKDGESGLVAGVGDKKALVEKMEILISDRELGKKLAQRAREAISLLPDEKTYLELYKKSFVDTITHPQTPLLH